MKKAIDAVYRPDKFGSVNTSEIVRKKKFRKVCSEIKYDPVLRERFRNVPDRNYFEWSNCNPSITWKDFADDLCWSGTLLTPETTAISFWLLAIRKRWRHPIALIKKRQARNFPMIKSRNNILISGSHITSSSIRPWTVSNYDEWMYPQEGPVRWTTIGL